MCILAIFQLVLKILMRSISEYRTHVINWQWQHITINVCMPASSNTQWYTMSNFSRIPVHIEYDWCEGVIAISQSSNPGLDALLYLHLDRSTGWEMTPSGCLLSCLQRIAEDCVQDWRKKTNCCHSQWWCCREENKNKDTAVTQMSFSDRYGVLLIFRSKFPFVVPGLSVGNTFGVCLLRLLHLDLATIKNW